MRHILVEVGELTDFCVRIFMGQGLKAEDAKVIADMLVAADVRGVRSHGVARVKTYAQRIKSGGARRSAKMEVVRDTPVNAVIDAGEALGGIVSAKASALARQKAECAGIGLVAVRRSNHFGMAGHWALQIAGENMIGFCGSNTYATMPPVGAKKPGIGNNPFAVAYSGEKYREICVDMATSVAAAGKGLDLVLQGKPIPEGWFLDSDGNSTTDYYKRAMLLPFAGHKGFGVAFIVETLSTFLSGGILAPEMNPQGNPALPELAGHFFGAIKIEAFRDIAEFRADVDRFIDFLKSLPTQDASIRVQYPGEIELDNKRRIMREGIRLPETLVEELLQVAGESGLSPDAVSFLQQ